MNINSLSLKSKIGNKGIRSTICGYFNKNIQKSAKNNSVLQKKKLSKSKVNILSNSNGELKNIFKPLSKFESVDVYVHGSWADDTKTPFSDLDDLIIIDEKKIKIENYKALKKALLKTENTFQKLDPLQHHGHWIISNSSLSNYDASFMPLFILENAVRIQGRQKIDYKVNIQATNQGLYRNLLITKNNIYRYYQRYQNRNLNIYELKCFVGSILLIPPMLFQLQGNQLDKRTAINESSILFSAEAIRSIEWASMCRRDWKEITTNKSFKIFAGLVRTIPHPKITRKFANKFSPKIYPHLHEKWPLKPNTINSYIEEIESYL